MHTRLNHIALLLVPLLLMGGAGAACAQGDDTPTPSPAPYWPLTLTIQATDGQPLAADLFLLGPANPTVILLHQLYTDRTTWGDLPGSLLAAGFNVLAVDVRGHGVTGGSINWNMAVNDVSAWIAWTQSVGMHGAISTLGSSMGSTLALVGCANDPACHTAVAISPGWSYYGVSVQNAFAQDFGARPALLVYAANDFWPAVGIPKMLDAAANPVEVEEYAGNAHGLDLIAFEADTLIPAVVTWLNLYGR